jgi:predicted HicB family RNase H-like nuclease
MGRPPLAEGRVKGIIFTMRLNPEERDAIVAAAEREGKPVRQWAREALLRAATSSAAESSPQRA